MIGPALNIINYTGTSTSNIFHSAATRAGLTTPGTYNGSEISTFEDAFSGTTISSGSDSTMNGISDLTFTTLTGTTIVDVNLQGIAIAERGGNDSITIRAVTGIDAFGTATAFGANVSASNSNWGNVKGMSYDLYEPAAGGGYQPRSPANLGGSSQQIAGVFFSMADLGISTGDTVYGYQMVNGGVIDLIGTFGVVTSETLVPEPSSSALLGLGTLGLLLRRRR